MLKLATDSELDPNDHAHILAALNSLSLLEYANSQFDHKISSLDQTKFSIDFKTALDNIKLIPLENCFHFLDILFKTIQYFWPRLKG
jgi:hypothetical protein